MIDNIEGHANSWLAFLEPHPSSSDQALFQKKVYVINTFRKKQHGENKTVIDNPSKRDGNNNKFIIGRKPDSSIVLTDVSISGHHCVIEWEYEDGQLPSLFVTDKSTNGTFVNRKKIAKDCRVALPDGSFLSLGKERTNKEAGGNYACAMTVRISLEASHPQTYCNETARATTIGIASSRKLPEPSAAADSDQLTTPSGPPNGSTARYSSIMRRLKEEKEQLDEELTKTLQDLEKSESEKRLAENEALAARSQTDAVKMKLKHAEERLNVLQNEAERRKDEMAVESDLSKQKLVDSQVLNESFKRKVDSLNLQLVELGVAHAASIKELKSEVASQSEIISDKQAALDRLSAEVASLLSMNQSVEQQHQQQEAAMQVCKTKICWLEADLSKLQEANEKLVISNRKSESKSSGVQEQLEKSLQSRASDMAVAVAVHKKLTMCQRMLQQIYNKSDGGTVQDGDTTQLKLDDLQETLPAMNDELADSDFATSVTYLQEVGVMRDPEQLTESSDSEAMWKTQQSRKPHSQLTNTCSDRHMNGNKRSQESAGWTVGSDEEGDETRENDGADQQEYDDASAAPSLHKNGTLKIRQHKKRRKLKNSEVAQRQEDLILPVHDCSLTIGFNLFADADNNYCPSTAVDGRAVIEDDRLQLISTPMRHLARSAERKVLKTPRITGLAKEAAVNKTLLKLCTPGRTEAKRSQPEEDDPIEFDHDILE